MIAVLLLDTTSGWTIIFQQQRALLWCLLLGLVGVYLLLPRPRLWPRWQGGLVGGLALVGAGKWLAYQDAAVPELLLFYAFAALAILGGVLLISQRNPVHAALSFVVVVLASCGLFLLQAAPFLMAATIVVYAGAIVVTFLFVIMLAQQVGLTEADQRSREPFLASLAGFVLLGVLLAGLHRTYDTSTLDRGLQRLQQAQVAGSLEEVEKALGQPPVFFEELKTLMPQPRNLDATHPLVRERLVFLDSLENADGFWAGRNLDSLKQELSKAHQAGRKLRQVQGSLPPDQNMQQWLSPYSSRGPAREGQERLPANNVAALGRSLFTDYLLAVELAGILLTVATIGAIAIAGRRTEGLR